MMARYFLNSAHWLISNWLGGIEMGAKKKYSHYCSTPIDREALLAVIDALDIAVHESEPQKRVSISVSGAQTKSIEIPSEKVAEIVEIMRLALNED